MLLLSEDLNLCTLTHAPTWLAGDHWVTFNHHNSQIHGQFGFELGFNSWGEALWRNCSAGRNLFLWTWNFNKLNELAQFLPSSWKQQITTTVYPWNKCTVTREAVTRLVFYESLILRVNSFPWFPIFMCALPLVYNFTVPRGLVMKPFKFLMQTLFPTCFLHIQNIP